MSKKATEETKTECYHRNVWTRKTMEGYYPYETKIYLEKEENVVQFTSNSKHFLKAKKVVVVNPDSVKLYTNPKKPENETEKYKPYYMKEFVVPSKGKMDYLRRHTHRILVPMVIWYGPERERKLDRPKDRNKEFLVHEALWCFEKSVTDTKKWKTIFLCNLSGKNRAGQYTNTIELEYIEEAETILRKKFGLGIVEEEMICHIYPRDVGFIKSPCSLYVISSINILLNAPYNSDEVNRFEEGYGTATRSQIAEWNNFHRNRPAQFKNNRKGLDFWMWTCLEKMERLLEEFRIEKLGPQDEENEENDTSESENQTSDNAETDEEMEAND